MSELKLQQCRLDGRYDILDCLGRGSYSEIYMARDAGEAGASPSFVVIKALNTSLQGTPDDELERTLVENFRNEALALDRVRHPHIISRLGHGTALDLTGRAFHYLVIEYMPGGDMGALCRHHPLAFDRALFYLEQVCAGLAHAHACGVIHRDIKPQNLLLSTDKRIVKIADFGVAKIKLIEAGEGVITRVGTDVYAAPEHHPLAQTGPLTGALTGEAATIQLTPAADIYSLAKTVFMLLTGDSPRHFSKKPITELPAPVNQQAWAQDALAVLRRATQTKASERYQTVEEFWNELRATYKASAPTPPQGNGDADGKDLSATFEPEVEARAHVVPQALPHVPLQPEPEQVNFVPRASHARIVVPVAARPELIESPAPESPRDSPARTASAQQQDRESRVNEDQRNRHAKPALAGRPTRVLVSLLLILTFAAMLLALHNYVSGMRDPFVGNEFKTATDVNLRSGPARNNALLGVVKGGSIVRVVERAKNTENSWLKVTVVQHALPKALNPADAGWMSQTNDGKPLLVKR